MVNVIEGKEKNIADTGLILCAYMGDALTALNDKAVTWTIVNSGILEEK